MPDYEPPENDEAELYCDTCDKETEHHGEWHGMMYCNECETEFDHDDYLRDRGR